MAQVVTRLTMRNAMIESLRREPPDQFSSLKRSTVGILTERGFAVIHGGHFGDLDLGPSNERRFREVLWSLINSGVLVQGSSSADSGWPFLSLTEMGDEFIGQQLFDVCDPDGYLAGLSATRPLDAVERRFARQAVGALNANLPDAAAVLIGAAAEHVVGVLCTAIGEADPSVTTKVARLRSQSAAQALVFSLRYVESRRAALDPSVGGQLATTFAGVAGMIRASRDDAGRPAPGVVDHDHALVLLQLFPAFRNTAHEIIDALPLTSPPERPGLRGLRPMQP